MEKKKIIIDGEVDLVFLFKTIWSGRIYLLKVTAIFVIFGLIIAFTSKVEYIAFTKLLPESTSDDVLPGNLGGLSGLAGLAGIDISGLSSGGGSLSPKLYPEIVSSLPFVLEVMNDTIYFENKGIHTTAFDYFENIDKPSLFGYLVKYTVGLPAMIRKMVGGSEKLNTAHGEFLRFNKEQWELIQRFRDRIEVEIDSETGLISIKAEMPDAYASAQVARRVKEEITEEVIEYQTEKANKNLEFIQSAFKDAQETYEVAENRLAEATDRNRNVASAIAEIEIRRLENQYNLTFEVYKGLASQVEQAKIQLKNDTPVFTVVEPVRIPEDNSIPNKPLILIISAFIGGLVSTISFLIRYSRGGKIQ